MGYSLMRGYNVPPIMFTESEIAALFMSGEITEQFGDDSLKKALADALLKVRAALPEGHKRYISKLGSSMEVWSRSSGFEMEKSLMPVQEAVVRRRCITIEYDTGGRGEITERTVEALGLMFYSRRWHLIAWCRLRQAIRDFRLDRMKCWTVLKETFSGHESFSIADFFKDEAPEDSMTPIQMECERWALERMLHEMPCRLTSKKELPDGRYRIEALAYSIEWMAKWLVGAGTSAVACRPNELRKLVGIEAEKIAELYRS